MSDEAKAASAAGDRRIANCVPRLISRLYRTADLSARADILAALIKPLGLLGLAAVASGAFAGFVQRHRGASMQIGLGEAGRYTSAQVLELARFVEQVDAEALQQVAGMALDGPAGFTTFGVAIALLVVRQYRRHRRDRGAAGSGR
jgi:hypothetical protein